MNVCGVAGRACVCRRLARDYVHAGDSSVSLFDVNSGALCQPCTVESRMSDASLPYRNDATEKGGAANGQPPLQGEHVSTSTTITGVCEFSARFPCGLIPVSATESVRYMAGILVAVEVTDNVGPFGFLERVRFLLRSDVSYSRQPSQGNSTHGLRLRARFSVCGIGDASRRGCLWDRAQATSEKWRHTRNRHSNT